MNLNQNYIKKQIFLKREFEDVDILHLEEAYYINVFLTKTCEIFEYVDVKRDEKIFKIKNQTINPYYIDFGFFDTVKRIKVNNENDLTPVMINYLKNQYSYLSTASTADVKSWFNELGYNVLINDVTTTVNEITGEKKQENGLEKLEKLQPKKESAVSKAYFFPISINK